MSEYRPFVGPSPFERKDSAIFFGRAKEANELVSLITSHTEVLLYAQSGAGKTSLINAKVMPMLEDEGIEVFPLARVQGPIPGVETEAIANIYAFHTLLSWAGNEANFASLARTSLDEYLKGRAHLIDEQGFKKARVIFFDQFEELFTFYPERWPERREFINCIRKALIDDPLLRVVFSMREDYVAELDPFVHTMPEKIRTRFRLERLREKAALEAVTKPVQHTERSFATGAAEELVNDLLEIRTESGNGKITWKDEFVEPVQLQVVCQNLWQGLPTDVKEITHEHLEESANVDNALSTFYEKSIKRAVEETGRVKEAALRRWFEEVLMTPAGTRGTVFRGQDQAGGMPIEVVKLLENEHLIRTEMRGRASWCELTHDRFIQPIRESNSSWFIRSGSEQLRRDFEKKADEWIRLGRGSDGLLDEAHLIVAERWLASPDAAEAGITEEMQTLVQATRRHIDESAHQHQLKIEKHRRRQLLWALVTLLILLMLSGGMSVFAFNQLARARREQNRAEAQKTEADKQTALATTALDQSETDRNLAREALEQAQKDKKEAARQRDLVKGALLDVTRARVAESGARKKAEDALTDLREAQKEVTDQKDRAEEQQRIAQSRELASYSVMQSSVDPELGVVLATEAAKRSRTDQAEESLRSALAMLTDPRFEMRGHTGDVHTAAFSPDAKLVVTASEDKTAKVWDASSGRELVSLVHPVPVRSAAFSPNGRYVVTASADLLARVWETSSGKLVNTLQGHRASVRSAAFSPDGKYIVTTSFDNTARVWAASTGVSIAELGGQYGAVKAAFSPDSKYVVTASTDATARVWETTGKLVGELRGHTGPVNNATFSPDGKRIATASGDSTARIWTQDRETKKWESIVELRGHTGDLYSASFSVDGKRIVTASTDATARVWDAGTGQPLAELIGHTGSVVAAAFCPDDAHIVTASADNTARVWDAATGKSVVDLRGHSASVNTATFSPSGESIVTASADNTARVWDTTPKRGLVQLRGHTSMVFSAVFSHDGKTVATASLDGTARIWDAVSGQTRQTLRAGSGWLIDAQFSPDDKLVVTASAEGADNTAHVWIPETGELVGILRGHSGGILSAVFSPNGKSIVTASGDGSARVWRAPSQGKEWKTVAELQGNAGALGRTAISPDGKLIAAPTLKGTVLVWKASGDGTAWLTFLSLEGHEKEVISAAFSPDGKVIVSGGADGTARLWDAHTGRPLGILRGHTSSVISASFSPSGNLIVTASEDKTARVWDATTLRLIAELRGHSDAVFTAAFSPDGQQIVTASLDGTARIYPQVTFASFDEIVTLATKRNLRKLTIAESEKYLHEPIMMPR